MRFFLSLLLAAALLAPATASANPPGNDHRKDAWTLTNGVSGTTAEATRESDSSVEGHRPGNGTRSVWFKWTAPTAGRLTVTVNAAAFDAVVAAYTTWREFNNGDVVSDADTGAGDTSSRIEIDAKAGQTFNVVVDGVAAGAGGAYAIATAWDTTPPPPANDDLADAQALTPAANPISDWTRFSHRYATKQVGEPTHRTLGTPNKSVWFKWTAPANGFARVTTDCGDADLESTNSVVAVYTGSTLATFDEVTYEPSQALGSCTFRQVRFKAVAGTKYAIAVDNASADTGMNAVRLEFDDVAPKVTFTAASVFGPQKALTFDSDEGYYEGVSYQCKLDAGVIKPCTGSYGVGLLAEGPHTLLARATDDMGNIGAWTSKTFTVDKTAPETTFTSGPAAVVAQSAGVQFTFASSENGATFRCQLLSSGQSWEACASPYSAIPGLSTASFTTRVAAIDAAGNVDPTPAVWQWAVDPAKATAPAPKPVAAPAAAPQPTVPATSAPSTRPTTPPAAVGPTGRIGIDAKPRIARRALATTGLKVRITCPQACRAQVQLLTRTGRVAGRVTARSGRPATLKARGAKAGRYRLRFTAPDGRTVTRSLRVT